MKIVSSDAVFSLDITAFFRLRLAVDLLIEAHYYTSSKFDELKITNLGLLTILGFTDDLREFNYVSKFTWMCKHVKI